MDDRDSVPWDDVEAATGPPSAAEVVEYAEEWLNETSLLDPPEPYEAVKAIYDEWKSDRAEESSLPPQGAAFVIAYLLEREGVVDLSDAAQGSLVERHPGEERLREMFWNDEKTLWWMAVELGVHYSLVTFWLWKADIPLAERNLSDETLRQVEAQRSE